MSAGAGPVADEHPATAAARDDWPHAGRYVIASGRSQLWSGGSVENRQTFSTREAAESAAYFDFGPGAWIGQLHGTGMPRRYHVAWYRSSTSELARADAETVELTKCPACHGEEKLRIGCEICVGDGRVPAHSALRKLVPPTPVVRSDDTCVHLSIDDQVELWAAIERWSNAAKPSGAAMDAVVEVNDFVCRFAARVALEARRRLTASQGERHGADAGRRLPSGEAAGTSCSLPPPSVRSEDPPTYGDPREAAGADATPSGFGSESCRYLETPDIDWPWAGRWLRTVSRRTGLSADTFLHPRLAHAPGTSDRESAVTGARRMFGADAQVAHVLRGSKPHHYRFRVANVPGSSAGEEPARGGIVSAAAMREAEERFLANLDEIQKRNAELRLVAGGQGRTEEDVLASARGLGMAVLLSLTLLVGAVLGAVVMRLWTGGGAA